MTIQDYKEATNKLMEFVSWSRENYTRTPVRMAGRIDRFFSTNAFNIERLSSAFMKLAQYSNLKLNETRPA